MYVAIINTGEHNGFIRRFDPAGLTPDGSLTYQEMCGSHGSVLCEDENIAVVEAQLAAWLDNCPAKHGGYCYTHSPR